MALSPQKIEPPACPAWVGPVKFLLLAVAVVSLYLLAQSMVRHRFFSGGYLDNRISTTQPIR